MKINKRLSLGLCVALTLGFTACHIPQVVTKTENTATPLSYNGTAEADSNSVARLKWKQYFNDPYLQQLIDTALRNNQELNIALQEIEMTRNEIRARKGEYLPFVNARLGAGVEKHGRYTPLGTLEANNEIKPGRETPDPLPDFLVGAFASWELDIWGRLHNAARASVERYLATQEGKNFLVTNLVAEVANSYYELLALDNQLAIVQQNIQLQTKVLDIMKVQKEAARVTELAVRRFQAQVLQTQSRQFQLQQQIVETENRLNYLLGRYPQPIARSSQRFESWQSANVSAGLPSQLLAYRPDIRQAEAELAAAKLDVKVARARFYPNVAITAGVGWQAFNPAYLVNTPASMIYSLGGDLIAPLVNRNAIKAGYLNANAAQIQAAFDYEKTLVNAYVEVANQLSQIKNLSQGYDLKARQVAALNESIGISTELFNNARADYMEVLLTQREALEAKLELIETRRQQMNASVNVYRALGGGWN